MKSDRGFSNNCVKAKFSLPKEKVKIDPTNKSKSSKSTPRVINKQTTKFKLQKDSSVQTINNLSPKKTVNPEKIQKLDVAIQSNLEMEPKEEHVVKKETTEKTSSTQDMLGSFLSQLMAQRPRNIFVENSTNTDANMMEQTDVENSNLQTAQNKTNVELKKTTDLLESLQKALSTDIPQKPKNTNNKTGK